MQKGIIIKVLEKDTDIPKAIHRWNREIEFDKEKIVIDYPAFLYYDNGTKVTKTSCVTACGWDKNNFTIWTENSIYYIKFLQ